LRDGKLVLNLSPTEVNRVLYDHDEEEYFAIYAGNGQIVASNGDLVGAIGDSRPTRSQFADGQLKGAALRVAILRNDLPAPFTAMVGQTTHSRQRLLRAVLERSVVPQLALLLVLGVYLWRQITRELDPLSKLQLELDRRGSTELKPIVLAEASSDVGRLKDSANALLARIKEGALAQRQFAGNVAHDLRTPLAGIRALAEYGLARDEAEVWREQLARILESEERASRLVDQLLAIALAGEAEGLLELEHVRVDELVRRIVLAFMPRADALGIDLGASGLDTPLSALASAVLLEGVLTNLIDNALRHGASATRPTVTVETGWEQGEVIVSVTDNGPGLATEQRETLGRRWARGGTSRLPGASGAGLGLAIATRYAELMKGSLELSDNPHESGLRAVLRLRGSEGAGAELGVDVACGE
jgi:two-component system sensor histidine kinase TctE